MRLGPARDFIEGEKTATGEAVVSNSDLFKGEMRLRISRRQLLAATGGLAGLAAAGLPLATGSARADTPQKGGTLKFGRVADVISFEPVMPTDNMSI